MTQSVTLDEGGKSVQFTDRQVPWMKIGKQVNGALTAQEAAKQGGLDFTVSLHDVFFSCDTTKQVVITPPVTNDDGEVEDEGSEEVVEVTNTAPDCLRNMTNRKVVVRDDTLEPLSIVSSGYPVLQYHEAFDFMDTAIAEMGGDADGVRYVAAGALKGGKQGFMVVRAPQNLQVNVLDGKDPHEMFLVLRTSMDLTRAVEVMAMPLRGLCMNQLTLTSFAQNVPHRWAVRHTSTMQAKLAEAKTSMAKMGAYVKRFNELATRLAAVKLNDEQAKVILNYVIPKHNKKREEVADTIVQKWHHALTVGFSGTGWGLVNAVSEYYDWRPTGTYESKFLNAMQGVTHSAINKTAAHILSKHSK